MNKNLLIFIAVVALVVIVIAALFLSKPAYAPLQERGNVKGTGTVEIIEFSDFQCPACGAAYEEVKKLMEQKGDKIRFTYKHFPLTSHPYAYKAAEASECAADQGKFWEYHDKLFDNQRSITKENLIKFAESLGLDSDSFKKCLESGAMSSRVEADMSEGFGKIVGATPTFFINGKKFEGALTAEKMAQEAGV